MHVQSTALATGLISLNGQKTKLVRSVVGKMATLYGKQHEREYAYRYDSRDAAPAIVDGEVTSNIICHPVVSLNMYSSFTTNEDVADGKKDHRRQLVVKRRERLGKGKKGGKNKDEDEYSTDVETDDDDDDDDGAKSKAKSTGKSRGKRVKKEDSKEAPTVTLAPQPTPSADNTTQVVASAASALTTTSSSGAHWLLHTPNSHRARALWETLPPSVAAATDVEAKSYHGCAMACTSTCTCPGLTELIVRASALADVTQVLQVTVNPNLDLPRWVATALGSGAVVINMDFSH